MTALLERLARAETAARQQADELRARLAEAEEQVRRLSITRETLMDLTVDEPEGGTAADGGQADEGMEDEQPGSPHQDLHDQLSTPLPVLRGVREQTVTLLATADRPMRAREVVRALGKPDTRSQVEGMRSRLQRLVADGWLRRREDGLYAIATGVNGRAPGGEAV